MMISNTLVEGHPLTWETKIFFFHRLSFSMKKNNMNKSLLEKSCQSKSHLIGDPMRGISLSDVIYCKSEGKPQERLTIHSRVGKIQTPL